jgi:4'-phosphopantetheinyl transferase
VSAPAGFRIAWAAVPDGVPRREVALGLLADLLPDARFVQSCAWCGGPHGPVRVEGVAALASVTYAGGTAIVGVLPASADALALGVDAESAQDPRRDVAGLSGVLGRDAAHDPALAVRTWTRIEAALKADGRGLRVDPADVILREDRAGWSAGIPEGAPVRGWDVPGPDGVVVSVAVRGAAVAAAASDRSSR